jgi:hypothetical protein
MPPQEGWRRRRFEEGQGQEEKRRGCLHLETENSGHTYAHIFTLLLMT